jgi:hypothetical protein
MQIVRTEEYRDSLRPQPWHAKLDEAKSYFENRYHQDITSQEGFNSVMSSEGWRDQYNDFVGSLVGDDEKYRESIKRISRHSMEDVRNPFAISTEATDTLANNANYSALAKLNSWIIVGYTARSKCLELYHTFSHDNPTVSFRYNISYIKKGNDPEEYIRPNADRDGDIGPLYDLPVIAPSPSQIGQPGFEHLADLGESFNGKNSVWLKIKDGVIGNIFKDNAGEFDPTKYTLEKNPMVVGVHWDVSGISGADAPTDGFIRTYVERQENTGEQQKKHFYTQITIPYSVSGTQKAADAVIMGVIDLDNGDYQFSVIGPIDYIQLDVRPTNVGNELGTIRAGNRTIVETFSVDNHPYGTVPVVPEMSDDFNAGGAGVSATAFFVDQVTGSLSSMRDIVMERDLDTAYFKGPKNHPLYAKLGGFKGSISFPLAARLPGGSDPFSWMTTGLKNTIIHHLTQADMLCYFEDNIPRQWYILGSESDINRVPDFTYSDWDGKDAGKAEKYGFTLDGSAGFMDSKQRSIRVIGSAYKRHYQNKAGEKLPMRLSCKAYTLEQPTSVYLPYSFRIYSGNMTEFSKRTGLIIAARDCISTLSCVQSRVNLVGNTDSLYSAICSWDAGSSTGPGSSASNPIYTQPTGTQNVKISEVDGGVTFPQS